MYKFNTFSSEFRLPETPPVICWIFPEQYQKPNWSNVKPKYE